MSNSLILDSSQPIKSIVENEDLYNAVMKLLNWEQGSNGSGYTMEDVQKFMKFDSSDSLTPPTAYVEDKQTGEEWYLSEYAGWYILDIANEESSTGFAHIAIDICLSVWTYGGIEAQFSEDVYKTYVAVLQGRNAAGDSLPDPGDTEAVLQHFLYHTIWGIVPSFSQEEASFDLPIKEFAKYASARLKIWRDYYVENDGIESSDDFENLNQLELQWINEEGLLTAPDPNIESTLEGLGLENLRRIATKGYSLPGEASPLAALFGNSFAAKIGELQTNAFKRAFSNVKIDEIEQLDKNIIQSLMNELQYLGIIDLISYAGQIADFAAKRAKSESSIQKSALQYIDEAVDLPWLLKLIEVEQQLRQSPLILFKLNYYLPSVMTFILDALAVTSDYSNGGLGGGREDDVNDPSVFLNTLEKAFGTRNGQAVFELAAKANTTANRLDQVLKRSPFRDNVSPTAPDMFHFRLGAANFYVPPVTIDINTAFKAGSVMSGALRQKNSPKFNSGYRETVIKLRLFFPNYEEIWGISIGDSSSINLNEEFKINFNNNGSSEAVIDKFLSSLRGLVAAFKYSPFLPVKNHYLNAVHGITAVGLSNMTIATIPNFPFALAVDLELVNFNHKPFLPMISDFNQAIHWGKYRQYMGKAAGHLSNYVNEEFLIKTTDVKEADSSSGVLFTSLGQSDSDTSSDETGNATMAYQNDILRTNIVKEWTNGNHLTMFVPAEAQTKLYLPSTSMFRTDEEKMITDLGTGTWESLLKWIGIDIDESASYGLTLADTLDASRENAYSKSNKKVYRDAIDMIIAGMNSSTEAERTYQSIVTSFIQENSKLSEAERDWLKDYNDTTPQYNVPGSWIFQGKYLSGTDDNPVTLASIKDRFIQIAKNPSAFLELLTAADFSDRLAKAGDLSPDYEMVKQDNIRAFNVALYEKFFQSGPIQSLLATARARAGNFSFNEWEVPMLRVDLDPEKVIINGVTVALGNILVKLQVQMHDEPTYQHIGGKDSFISISMTVIGETELIKLKKIFDHISGLARLEHASGVIGFLGIKNIITALAGIKYVMPLNYSVNTRPNYPHIYDVQLSLVDFDIFQQKREELSNRQQKDMIEYFGSKKNPFLRIKQLWGSFNAYPDFPLTVKDEAGDTVGTLDPDFYFRSFEIFDKDVIYNISSQNEGTEDFTFNDIVSSLSPERITEITAHIQESVTNYAQTRSQSTTNPQGYISEAVNLAEWVKSQNDITNQAFLKIFYDVVATSSNKDFITESVLLRTEFIDLSGTSLESDPYYMQEVRSGTFQVGDITPRDSAMAQELEAALNGSMNLPNENEISFDPDEVTFFKQIHLVPSANQDDISKNRIPAILQTSLGTYYGYTSRENGRFYLTIDGTNALKEGSGGAGDYSYKFAPNPVEDAQTPDKGTTNSMTGVYGTTPLSEYQKPYSGEVSTHWEKMMIDTSYRDSSGRMLRAFPTYMLWLIDEGGYFAGVKLFDNFYGLQSIIDFSVVSSEDLLGDTLIFRLSNLYSKLTKKESTELFNTQTQSSDGMPTMLEGLGGIIERTLNMSRNLKSGLRNEYVVDIASIRLKPGVRVHLRAGYGSNPNSLQTVFNGTITNVEQGEIVTVTAQSDAMELGAVINSTNKNTDSGKIDGGIDTGMYLSEPRDLMVRLLTMGSSRTKEAFARATRGTVFSENKFGIRHFGTILYEPLSELEQRKNEAVGDSVSAAFTSIGGGKTTNGFSFNLRGNTLGTLSTLWANFSSQVDLEIYKRNIYPGNGLGVAQFMGGDTDDGWATVSAYDEKATYNDRVGGYIGRLTDVAYNNILTRYEADDINANATIGALTASNRLISSEGRAGAVKGVIGTALTAVTAVINPVAGVATGIGLLGVLQGRGGTNVFRTMGLISPNPDDDLQGFDEVSFRAQTYMRTVWDLFQVCARLLPNYIVAIRPFEDRSTVFYGKPHWLYTSGVVPLTTGYPTREKAIELGISPGPDTKQPDEVLAKIYDTINKDTNPLSDYAAFFKAKEPTNPLSSAFIDLAKSTGIYSPSTYLLGKVINFYTEAAKNYHDFTGDGFKCTLPVSKGKVYIGPHLPVVNRDPEATNNGVYISSNYNSENEHKQLDNLPPRYRYPYFTFTENAEIKNSATITLKPAWKIYSDYGYDDFEYNKLQDLTKLEVKFYENNKYTLMPSEGDGTLAGSINLDTPLPGFSDLTNQVEGIYSFNAAMIVMPIPKSATFFNRSIDYNDDYSFEFDTDHYQLTYQEWEAPTNDLDEQFYIAMRWPYIPPTEDQATLDKFKSEYNLENFELTGTAQDYKNTKVLVYNPSNGRAVVCRPAFFMWGDADYDAMVSPDAAYFLSIITYNQAEAEKIKDGEMMVAGDWYGTNDKVNAALEEHDLTTDGDKTKLLALQTTGYRDAPASQDCYFAFVPNRIPVGVLSPSISPISEFQEVDSTGAVVSQDSDAYIVGFGKFASTNEGSDGTPTNELYATRLSPDMTQAEIDKGYYYGIFFDYKLYNVEVTDSTTSRIYGGNPLNISDNKSYFELTLEGGDKLDKLTEEDLTEIRKTESEGQTGTNRQTFMEVYDPADEVSVQARQYYDEKFDPNTSVIAGNGRNLQQAQEIWDRFRAGYHTYESVKAIFARVYGLDPDSEVEFPPLLKGVLSGDFDIEKDGLQKFNLSGDGALDEFEILFGSDYITKNNEVTDSDYNDRLAAIEFMRSSLIDAPASENGLIAYLNDNLVKLLGKIHGNFFDGENIKSFEFLLSGDTDKTLTQVLTESIKTPKQLFYFIVGIFRQRMWEDPYARAWLVLRPDKKHGVDSGWSFRPVDKIFLAFIDPYQDYAKPSKKDKFRKLLSSTRAEGNNETTWFGEAIKDTTAFLSATIGPIASAVTDAISGLTSMFKMSMQQLGYALSEVGNFKKQANILNKAFNDSIYYSLGREGSILRAADNPFTREYGEPVIEIREPFQRLHYISSFSHILSNQIQENINGVATSITAVSDGKYPVTVALDKGAPAERQVERTVETGILFDNVMGGGLFTGFLHPFLHPLETIRGASKLMQGAPDELSARRIALAHLKESIKDIYGGELLVIGNTDIRPHDLVYLSDVYERMYGMFEVEQVVHHFTPELGFVTSITPNALVTINDPARWFRISWLQSWMHVQTLRNDTRIHLDSIRSANSGLMIGGNISIDRLGEILSPQLVGGYQFTHGSSALIKDIVSNETAKNAPGQFDSLVTKAKEDGGSPVDFMAMLHAIPVVGPIAWSGWKWVRDNVLDQHGCYVQYLNKNGQPMDAGLSYNQGMVVGQHHSTKLLPGLLGSTVKTRSPEGHAYIRSDDLFKSLGWNETEISDLSRFISYETALVQARVLNMAGLGPDKATFSWKFKVLCHVTHVIDGDTVDVVDILSGATFRVRFDGVNAGETNTITTGIGEIAPDSGSVYGGVLDLNTPGGRAKAFVKSAIENKLVVLKINQTRTPQSRNTPKAVYDRDFEAGAVTNVFDNYTLDIFSRNDSGSVDYEDSTPRALATIFYHLTEESYNSYKTYISNIFRENLNDTSLISQIVMNDIYDGSPFFTKFTAIYDYIDGLLNMEFFDITDPLDPLFSLSDSDKVLFSNLVYFKMLQELYDFTSKWPEIGWDEYYGDGYPATLNWELVVNNLARVFIKDLQKESQSVQSSYEVMAKLTQLNI